MKSKIRTSILFSIFIYFPKKILKVIVGGSGVLAYHAYDKVGGYEVNFFSPF